MQKAYVKNLQGAWLVEGKINDTVFNGHGRPYAFNKKIADLLCKTYGFTQSPAKSEYVKIKRETIEIVMEVLRNNMFSSYDDGDGYTDEVNNDEVIDALELLKKEVEQ
jgi:hypothetical protein